LNDPGHIGEEEKKKEEPIEECLEGIFRRVLRFLFLLVKTFSFCVTNKQYKDVEKRLNRP
jgi:hypothetical protein